MSTASPTGALTSTMPPSRGDSSAPQPSNPSRSAQTKSSSPSTSRSIFSIPQPIKALFDRFPLHAYPRNLLPLQAASTPVDSTENNLYLHLAPDAHLSHDPQHLKLQTYLTLLQIPHALIPLPSSHSPPYLIPSYTSVPLSHSRLINHIEAHTPRKPSPSSLPATPSSSILLTTIETALRASYLYALLQHPTFDKVVRPSYINPLSSAWVVRAFRGLELKRAWMEEIARLTSSASFEQVDEEALWDETIAALDFLEARLDAATTTGKSPTTLDRPNLKRVRSGMSTNRDKSSGDFPAGTEERGAGGGKRTLLGSDEYEYVDAVLFAYVHCIMQGLALEGADTWAGRLWKAVKVRERLVEHWRNVRDCVV